MNTLPIRRMSCIPVILSALLFHACEKDPIPNESELITTVRFVLSPTEPMLDTVILQFRDPDGDGGIAPEITNGELISGASYSGQLYLLNESVSPAIRIDQEVLQEAENHQLFYTVHDSLDLQFQYQDQDINGNPLGLKVECLSGRAGQGGLTLTLRHEPDKTAAGVREGRIQNAGGETDIEVRFEVRIK